MSFVNPYWFSSLNASAGALANLGSDFASGASAENIDFDETIYDGGYWEGVTNPDRLTIFEDGIYRVASGFAFNTTGTVTMSQQLNGAAFNGQGREYYSNSASQYGAQMSGILSLSANDYITYRKETAASRNFLTDRTFLSIEKLSDSIQYALVNKTTGQTFSSTASLTFDNEVADVGGWHDNVTNNSRLTVPSGVTLIRLTASCSNGGTTSIASTTKNGASYFGRSLRSGGGAGGLGHNLVGPPLVVTAGDYFEFPVFHSASATVPANEGTWFCIEEVEQPATYQRVLVKKTGTQAITAGSPSVVTWDAEEYDTASMHDNVTNNTRLTVPSGVTRARVSFGLVYASATDLLAYVSKNGSDPASTPGTASDQTEWAPSPTRVNSGGAWMDVSPGDYFELYLDPSNSGNVNNDDATWFCMEVY